MVIWLPCPNCGDDSTFRAVVGLRSRCAECGYLGIVGQIDGGWLVVHPRERRDRRRR